MSQTHSRYIQVGDWYFEIKAVRALKVDEYGEPYQAIANCNINGNKMYIDGLLNKDDDEFSKHDFKSFYQFAQKIGLDEISYHRFQNGESVHKEILVAPEKQVTASKTVKKNPQEEVKPDVVPMRLVK
ncbi:MULTISPECIES: hypothetical protein [Thalassotalea]|uniref:hypothetical protein n=1 Tax=Thalassotalea TaxID=1518149 RepID=UPI000942BD1D|nr:MULTISPECIES: hypothetical protein [Thalassotalea]OKY26277.1 hypothetical protein BI291_12765 [Thalassotalea sp. PP2-459]